MTRKEAYFACRDLGEDWRLPSVEEFDIMYRELFLSNMGDFNGHFFSHSDGYSGIAREYWTAKVENEYGLPQIVWGYNFDENGWAVIYNRTAKLGIRLVRSI